MCPCLKAPTKYINLTMPNMRASHEKLSIGNLNAKVQREQDSEMVGEYELHLSNECRVGSLIHNEWQIK